jgi:hypothetical protein
MNKNMQKPHACPRGKRKTPEPQDLTRTKGFPVVQEETLGPSQCTEKTEISGLMPPQQYMTIRV